MTLNDAHLGEEYIIQAVNTEDSELEAFLFTLGIYSGEPITVISRLHGSCVIAAKDSRYNIDNALAKAIII